MSHNKISMFWADKSNQGARTSRSPRLVSAPPSADCTRSGQAGRAALNEEPNLLHCGSEALPGVEAPTGKPRKKGRALCITAAIVVLKILGQGTGL